MKKQNNIWSLLIFSVFIATPILGQDAAAIPPEAPGDTANLPVVPNDPDAESVGRTRTADENIQTVLLDDFEIPQGWHTQIPLDFGISRELYRDGGPKEIQNENNKFVLGIKTIFFRRNFGWMSIDRPYPLTLRNVVKNFSFWLVGRNRRHVISVKVRDVQGNRMRLPAGEMKWQGWKKVMVPVTDPVVQFDPLINRKGLDVLGFHVDFKADDITTAEPYYLYFDYFTASMNFQPSQAQDDMVDNW